MQTEEFSENFLERSVAALSEPHLTEQALSTRRVASHGFNTYNGLGFSLRDFLGGLAHSSSAGYIRTEIQSGA